MPKNLPGHWFQRRTFYISSSRVNSHFRTKRSLALNKLIWKSLLLKPPHQLPNMQSEHGILNNQLLTKSPVEIEG